MKKFFRYLAAKLRLNTGCDASLKDGKTIEQEQDPQGDTELACAVVERIQDVYNSMSYGLPPDGIPSDKPFCFLMLDRPLTWEEQTFNRTYHFEAKCKEENIWGDGRTAYFFHSLHSLYFKRKL